MLAQQFDSAVYKDRTEHIDDPMEAIEQGDAGNDEDGAHDQRADDSPEQHLMLKLPGHSEIAKDQKEDEKIVHAERELDDVTGDELKRKLLVGPRRPPDHLLAKEIDQNREQAGQTDPHDRPADRLAEADVVLLAMKDAEIERQHRQHEHVEDDPEDPV